MRRDTAKSGAGLFGGLVKAKRSAELQTARFKSDESGVVTAFATFMILMMLLVGGIGVDLMRNEMDRTRLQATLDRAVLAAADLDQDLDPTAVVTDYFEKAGLSEFLASVEVDDGLNFRIVTATARSSTKNMFMSVMGRETLPLYGVATAEERVAKVEISLVVDISGSMGRNSKMENLQDAAKVFVDTVLVPGTEDLISISLVPYTAQVNAGPSIMNELLVDRGHNYSHCIDFIPTDFDETTISFTREYEQMQHFAYYTNSPSTDPVENPGCPQETFERILPFSQNNWTLKNTIDQYTARHNTAIHLGMKWGVAMLDPSFRPITQTLSLNNEVEGVFAGRPAAYEDTDTLKTIVLMTDGQNVNTVRLRADKYDTPSKIAHWYTNGWVDHYYDSGMSYSSFYADYFETKYSAGQADIMLGNICQAAKDNGIVIWSIGFEVTNYSAGIMRDCASSPSHFFRVTGTEISDAFESIARQINQLRLTQ